MGDELVVVLHAASRDGPSHTSFTFDTDAPDVSHRAGLLRRPDGSAVFRFRPAADDVGRWLFDFRARDSGGTALEEVRVTVRRARGAEASPVFRRPLGAGTALDLSRADCAEIQVEVSDPDSPAPRIRQAPPVIAGASLEHLAPGRARWRWCPTMAQVTARGRYLLTLSADDGDGPATLLHYQVVLVAAGRAGPDAGTGGACQPPGSRGDPDAGAAGDQTQQADAGAPVEPAARPAAP